MPSVLRVGSYRFFFYSADRQEPRYVHITRGRANAKFWLEPIAFASASGFNARELLDIQSLMVAHQQLLLKSWHDYFGSAH